MARSEPFPTLPRTIPTCPAPFATDQEFEFALGASWQLKREKRGATKSNEQVGSDVRRPFCEKCLRGEISA